MDLNVKKTKDRVLDLRRTKTQISPFSIRGEELVKSYGYLSIHLNSKLDSSVNIEAKYMEGPPKVA